MARRRNDDLRERVLLAIGCVITVVWAIATLVQVAYPSHVVSGQVHLVMLTVAAGFFGGAAIQARKNSNGKDDDA